MAYTGYARIRDDMTRPTWCFKSRTDPTNKCGVETFYGKYLPEACRNFHGPSNFKLSETLQQLVINLNADEGADAIKYLNRWGSGWRNNGESWQVEGLSFARNCVYVTNLNLFGDKAFVLAIDVTKPPQSNLSYTNRPWLVQEFTVITPFNTTVLPSFGDPKHDGQIFLILMQDYRQRYFRVEDLEFFPALPYSASVTVGGLNVRSGPTSAVENVKRVARLGDPLVIDEYAPRGSVVWGKIGADEWVALAHPYVNDWFATTWRMQTLPPPVF